jgi:hypothetical protein
VLVRQGELFKFSQYEFAEAVAQPEGKTQFKVAIGAVRAGISSRERLRNIQMLTLASGLPVKAFFDWFIGPGDGPGEVVIFGDPCSDDILAQREKDAEVCLSDSHDPTAKLTRVACPPLPSSSTSSRMRQ